jgi:DNA-binding NarL/FixJ family response regulator
MTAGTILVADDHPLFRQAMVLAVSKVAPAARIIEVGTLDRAAEEAAAATDLRLILLDLKMPGAQGFSGLALLHAERPGIPILIISSADGPGIAQDARRFGAVGFIGKDRDLATIESAVANALAGQTIAAASDPELDPVAAQVASLTPMQLKVLLGVLAGRLNKQIAYDLSISEATVKAHMTAILRKLDVQNRTQAVLAARALGIGLQHP